MIGERATEAHYDRVIAADEDVYESDLFGKGRLVLSFRKRALPWASHHAAWRAWHDVDCLGLEPSYTRRAAAGVPDLEEFRRFPRFADAIELLPETPTTCFVRFADGRVLKQPMSNPVHSYLAGYGVDRFTNRAHLNLLTNRFPDRWVRSLPLFRSLDAVMEAILPDVHDRQWRRCMEHPAWRIPGTAFSTVTINVNYESRYHLDTGDFENGYSALSVVEIGEYRGGLYVLPEHRIAVDVREGDVLFCQSHVDIHGNTALEKLTPDAKRISFVVYLKHALATAVNRMEASA
jgi:hypothetical protein